MFGDVEDIIARALDSSEQAARVLNALEAAGYEVMPIPAWRAKRVRSDDPEPVAVPSILDKE